MTPQDTDLNPLPPSLPPATPFAPEHAKTPTGCGRIALVGCGFATLLLGLAAVVFLFKANDLLSWTLRQIESQLATRLPSDLTADEKVRLTGAFSAARGAIAAGKLDPRALQTLQGKLQRLSGVGTTPPTRQEILSLTESLELVGRGAEPPATPVAVPTASP